MRFAVSLFVMALGAILTFGIPSNPSGVNIHAIGVILMFTGAGGLAIAHWLYTTRLQTDIIYRPDGQTWIEPLEPTHHDVYGPTE